MEGSIFSILPLLLLIFLGLPAIIPNFTGRLHLGLEKLVQFWGFLNEGYRKVVSLWDFILFHPVVQLPICIVGSSSAAAYLVQNSVKTGNNLGKNYLHFSIKYSISVGIDYISFYLLIIFIQFSFIWIMQIMSRIRGKKSGLSPQRFRWVFLKWILLSYGRA